MTATKINLKYLTDTYPVFEPKGFGLEIFKSRHAHEIVPGFVEDWDAACWRVATAVARAELDDGKSGEQFGYWREVFYEILRRNLLMPGGRIWYGAGRPRGQLLNCFVIPTEDSREGWGKTVSDSIVISGTGGGVGLNASPVRPRGSAIHGTGGVATGAVSLMQVVDAAGEVIKAGGGRRTALMLCLNLSHGDIQEFLDKKLDLDQLNNANVSVVFNDDPEYFFSLVDAGGNLNLLHNGEVVGSIAAKPLWDKIVANALKTGEPGILNGYLANRMSNIAYIEELVSTNPCGEIWMSPYDCCCLGALVLPRFMEGTELDTYGLFQVTTASIRFLDNVLTVNTYPLPEIKAKCEQLRRIGLGVTGLHDAMLLGGMRYNSKEGRQWVGNVMEQIQDCSYYASSDLAAEKGSFPGFDKDSYLTMGHTSGLNGDVRDAIAKNGMRNCAVNTIAPTGTISIVCGTSSGIEPIFAPAYVRTYRKGEDLAEEVVIHPLFQAFMDAGKDVSHFQGAHDLSIEDHLEMQVTCQNWVDNAVSKTINLPAGTTHEELSHAYMRYLPRLKGVTVYPDGSRENQPLRPIPLADAMEAAKTKQGPSISLQDDRCGPEGCDL